MPPPSPVSRNGDQSLNDTIYSLVASGDEDAALDLLFNTFEDLYEAGRFGECDQHIQAMDLNKLGVCLVTGVLSITLCARDKLASRAPFLQKAEDYFQRVAPERKERLLWGLR